MDIVDLFGSYLAEQHSAMDSALDRPAWRVQQQKEISVASGQTLGMRNRATLYVVGLN